MPIRLPLLAALGLVLAAPALAQTRPTLMPARDVSVVYRLTSQAGGAEMRISWLPARNLMRMDLPGGQGWMLMDIRAGSGVMVMDGQRMIMDLPAGQGAPAGLIESPTARYTREAPARVANLECVNWRVEDRGETARICITADGVMLRAEGGGGGQASPSGVMEATSVTFGTQDPARFQRPAGYQTFQMPTGAPQGGGRSGRGSSAPTEMPRGTAIPPPGVTIPGK